MIRRGWERAGVVGQARNSSGVLTASYVDSVARRARAANLPPRNRPLTDSIARLSSF
jgi:hypothetical protein